MATNLHNLDFEIQLLKPEEIAPPKPLKQNGIQTEDVQIYPKNMKVALGETNEEIDKLRRRLTYYQRLE